MRSRAQTAQRGDVLVYDCKLRQRFGKRIEIVLRIRARARNGADVGHEVDLRCLEQVDELAHRPGGMSDSEERICHLSPPVTVHLSLLAFALCRATRIEPRRTPARSTFAA